MVQSCAAYGCTNRRLAGTKLSFHWFPKEKDMRRKWTIACRRKNWRPTKFSVLCSQHFTPDDFYPNPCAARARLLQTAVPSVFQYTKDLVKMRPPHRRKRCDVLMDSSVIHHDHSYCVSGQQAKSDDKVISPRETQLAKKVKILQQKCRRQARKIRSLNDFIIALKNAHKATRSGFSAHTS